MSSSVAEASEARLDRVLMAEIDGRLALLLANYQAVTADPRKMGYLRFLLKHYAKSARPFTDCTRDNLKRWGPGRTEGMCAVLKDTIRQTTFWRHGKGGHSKVPDAGAPGVAIAEADKGAAPAWGGHRHLSEERPVSLLDELDGEFGVVDHREFVVGAMQILLDLDKHCPGGVYRVLVGLDEAPTFKEVAA